MLETRNFYDEQFEGDYRTKVTGYEVARQAALQHFITKLLKLNKAKTVLDYGSGNGLYIKLWEKVFPKAELHFCDISSVALDKLKETYPEYADRCYLMNNDRVNIGDNLFDVVVSVEVMEHVADLKMYLQDIHRVLKPEGYFIWTTPCANMFSIEHLYNLLTRQIEPTTDGYRRWTWEGPLHLRRLKSSEAKVLLEENGFYNVKFRFRSHFFSFVCTRMPRRIKRLTDPLMKLDYALFRNIPNGASMLGAVQKRNPGKNIVEGRR